MAQSEKSGGQDPQSPGERNCDEKAFIENWWRRKFSMPNPPTGDDVIMFTHALELLKAFRGTGDVSWMTGPTEKSFLEAWWLRKFPVNPPKWGSILSLADAEALLIEFRKSTETRRPKDVGGREKRLSCC
jgi:hypothetical protein